jgi:cell division protein FtsL
MTYGPSRDAPGPSSGAAAKRSLLVEDTIDNTRVVRWRDARLRRDVLLLGTFLFGLSLVFVVYGWPRAQLRLTGTDAGKLQRDKEKLLEENRQLRLEKAALEDPRRIDAIARERLGLTRPAPQDVVVVERPNAARKDSRIAESAGGASEARPDARPEARR